MKKEQIAVQLYSFRDHIQNIGDIVETFRKLKKTGYDCIELSPSLTLSAEDTIRILSDEGIRACGSGINSIKAVADPGAAIDHLKKLDCKRAVYAYPHIIPKNEDELSRFIEELKSFVEIMRKNGIRLNYHNHAIEFIHFRNKSFLDIIYDEIPGLDAELDLFWIQTGGGSPLSWIKKMKGRMEAIHIKDYGTVDGNQRMMMPIGMGNLEWDVLIPAAEEAGVKYFVVEHDADCKDPFESFKISMDYLNENFKK